MRLIFLLLLTGCFTLTAFGQNESLHLTRAQAGEVGLRIWKNECDGTVEGLTSWNEGEAFPSLGIGHFIWYPEGRPGHFEESFPELLAYMKLRGIALPVLLQHNPHCPWKNSREYFAPANHENLRLLQQFLSRTVDIQAQFAAQRLENALPKMLATLPVAEASVIRKRFYAVAATPNGIYALMDYVNFKGEGVKLTERYQGQGWGLLQVLQGMKPNSGPASREFSASAIRVLTRRVALSPPERGEKRWLDGWTMRCRSYGE